jgi:hypothetical protein
VVRKAAKSHDPDLVAVAGAGECTEDDAVEQGLGGEEQPALEGAGGDLHQGAAVWDVAKGSGHGGAAGEQTAGQSRSGDSNN